MLFDLSGKRRRVVQVVYATLAILMGGSLVLFGIGSDAPGGILDALGLGGGGSSGSTDPQYEEEIDDAEQRLAENPTDAQALAELVILRYRSGASQLDLDEETGATTVTPEARDELVQARDAWDRYLELKPKRPDAEAATSVAQISDILFRDALTAGDAQTALDEAEDAADAYRIAAEASNRAPDFGGLATYLYISGDDAAAERASRRALELSDPSARGTLARRLEQTAKQTKELNDELERLVKAGQKGSGDALQDPFGGLGPTGSGDQLQPTSP